RNGARSSSTSAPRMVRVFRNLERLIGRCEVNLADAIRRETEPAQSRPAAAAGLAVAACCAGDAPEHPRPGRRRGGVSCVGAAAAALLLSSLALPLQVAGQERPSAVDADNLEVTMRLLPEGATRPDPVTRRIELPGAVRAQAASGAQGASSADDGAGAIAGSPQDTGTADASQ